MGLCSEEEKKAIERWFETLDDPSLNLKTDKTPVFEKEHTWSKISEIIPELKNGMSLRKAKRIHLFINAMRYAAAACFIFAAFFGGRLSVGSANASPAPDDPTADHLYTHRNKGLFPLPFSGNV